MLDSVLWEITPLTSYDCFALFTRNKEEFNFPLHNHEDMELNLILNANGAKRIIGDHIEEISDIELVLVGSNLSHGWFTHNCTTKNINEFTIQFHKDLFDDLLLKRNQLHHIRNMFENSQRGISFSAETVKRISPRIIGLNKKTGFDSILELLSIFHDLSTSREMKLLSDTTFTKEQFSHNSRRIEKVFNYMNSNFHREISLEEVSKVANMPNVSFSRFIKKRTGFTFVESLTEIRLGHVSRMLIDTTHSIAEIAYKCGFNNIANFNRVFKKQKKCTPKDLRANYASGRVFI